MIRFLAARGLTDYDYPAEADVRNGTSFAGGEYAGTLSAEADYPSEDDVRDGVTFDTGGKTGNLVLPSEAQTQSGVQFGANGTEFEGTLDQEVLTDLDISVTIDSINVAVAAS